MSVYICEGDYLVFLFVNSMYRNRIADQLLSDQLKSGGLIQGPKWCGKTTTAKQQAKSVLYMDDPRTREANIILSEFVSH